MITDIAGLLENMRQYSSNLSKADSALQEHDSLCVRYTYNQISGPDFYHTALF